MDLHPVDILINIINVIVLFVLLRLILWKPVIRSLDERAGRVRTSLDEADKARSEAEALRQKYASTLEGVAEEGREIMRKSQATASAQAEEIVSDAHNKANIMLTDARRRIADEKAKAVETASGEVAELAAEIAARILKRDVSPMDSMSAVEDFFREMN